MMWFDRTTSSVIAGCRSCGAREVWATQAAADTWASAHAREHLEEARRAIASLQARTRRP